MTISRADFGSFINELVTRNPNLGIPALEDRLFANSLIFDYLYYIFLGREKGRETENLLCYIYIAIYVYIAILYTNIIHTI